VVRREGPAPEPCRVPTGVPGIREGDPSGRGSDAQHRALGRFDAGGHLAALETPTLLINDIRSFSAAI
jgi:epoxide hydrolase